MPGVKFQITDQGTGFRKDAILDRLAWQFNVAQFVSFSPSQFGPVQEYSRVLGCAANERFSSVEEALGTLLDRSGEQSVNVRSYREESAQSQEFIYGLRNVQDALAAVKRLSSLGSFTIVNETIDVSDGGISGVAMGNIVEFRPDSTPRGVEAPGFATLSHAWAKRVFQTVYGFAPRIEAGLHGRLEFSLHPKRRGYRHEHVVHWEFGPIESEREQPSVSWPNAFSRMLGDKVYGLLIADAIGMPVPATTVFNRRIAPFSFGRATGSAEQWLRTSPREQVPGRYTTSFGWQDPFKLLQSEDPNNEEISSVISQSSVNAAWSGASIETQDGSLLSEGVSGFGENFMLGMETSHPLPAAVLKDLSEAHQTLRQKVGPVRFEWAHDGSLLWILQLHRGAGFGDVDILVPGDAECWVTFDVTRGLEELRCLVANIDDATGILLEGAVGRTSHIADVVRKAGVPARFKSV